MVQLLKRYFHYLLSDFNYNKSIVTVLSNEVTVSEIINVQNDTKIEENKLT